MQSWRLCDICFSRCPKSLGLRVGRDAVHGPGSLNTAGEDLAAELLSRRRFSLVCAGIGASCFHRQVQKEVFLPQSVMCLSVRGCPVCKTDDFPSVLRFSRLPEAQQRVGGCFLNLMPQMKTLYLTYCANHPSAVNVLTEHRFTRRAPGQRGGRMALSFK